MKYGGKPNKIVNGYPPSSPDLNPIENIFSVWDHNVKKRNPKNVNELIEIVKQEWSKISLTIIRNCIKRLPKVMEWVDTNNGIFYNE